jgi:hypothetical protein
MLNIYVLSVIAIFAYVLYIDSNIAPFLVLQTQRLGLTVRRAIWMIRLHPQAPWTKFAINRRARRLAKELRDSYDKTTPN